jgi:predicted amidohydrolase YtcJ
VLRCGDEAQGSEAAAVVGLSPTHLVGRPLVARYGRLVPAEPCRLRLEAGRIAACALLDASRLPRDAVIVGDADALLLPAFADPHIHLVACAADRAGIDLSDDPPSTHAQLLDRLRVAATLLPAGTWLRVSGYDEAWLEERRHPTRAELDDALPRHPLRLRHATRHATVLNSLGWARVEETVGGPSPDRAPRAADGSPLGPVFGLEPEITRAVGPIEPAALAQGLRVVGGTLARLGIVHLDEVTASNDAARVKRLAGAVAAGDLPQRVRAFVGDADEAEPARRAAADVVTVAGVKLLARSTDEVHGREFIDRLQRARRCGLPVAVHAVEPDVIVAVLDALAAAPTRAGAMDVPDRIEHASLCPPEVAQRIARAGVAVVTQPAFVAWRGDKYRREVEAPLHEWLYPLRDLRAAGVLVAAGSDAPVVPLDPRLALDGAVRRTTRDGDVIGPGQSLDEGAALDLITSAPARLRGESAPHGLVAGAVADALVVDADTWAERWRGLRVLHTLAAGRVIA